MNIKLFITKHNKKRIFLLPKLTVMQSVSINSTTQDICNIYKENMINNTYLPLVSINKIVGSSSREERWKTGDKKISILYNKMMLTDCWYCFDLSMLILSQRKI